VTLVARHALVRLRLLIEPAWISNLQCAQFWRGLAAGGGGIPLGTLSSAGHLATSFPRNQASPKLSPKEEANEATGEATHTAVQSAASESARDDHSHDKQRELALALMELLMELKIANLPIPAKSFS
jgi:hypothetical protein